MKQRDRAAESNLHLFFEYITLSWVFSFNSGFQFFDTFQDKYKIFNANLQLC